MKTSTSKMESARKIVMDMIPEGSTIAVGGSVTLNQTGILDEIRKPEYKFIVRYNVKSYEEMLDKVTKQLESVSEKLK